MSTQPEVTLEDLHNRMQSFRDKITESKTFSFPEDNPEHPDHDEKIASAWRGRDKSDRNVEARIFSGMRIIRVEFLDDRKKYLDHIDFTFEEYAHICGFKDMVENDL